MFRWEKNKIEDVEFSEKLLIIAYIFIIGGFAYLMTHLIIFALK